MDGQKNYSPIRFLSLSLSWKKEAKPPPPNEARQSKAGASVLLPVFLWHYFIAIDIYTSHRVLYSFISFMPDFRKQRFRSKFPCSPRVERTSGVKLSGLSCKTGNAIPVEKSYLDNPPMTLFMRVHYYDCSTHTHTYTLYPLYTCERLR